MPKNVTSCISRKKHRKESWLGKQQDFPTQKIHVNYEAGKCYFMKGFAGGGPKRNILRFLVQKKPTNKGDFSRYCFFCFFPPLSLAVVSKLRRGGRRKRIQMEVSAAGFWGFFVLNRLLTFSERNWWKRIPKKPARPFPAPKFIPDNKAFYPCLYKGNWLHFLPFRYFGISPFYKPLLLWKLLGSLREKTIWHFQSYS